MDEDWSTQGTRPGTMTDPKGNEQGDGRGDSWYGMHILAQVAHRTTCDPSDRTPNFGCRLTRTLPCLKS